MNHAVDKLEPSRLQKAVETIAITPEAATHLVDAFRANFGAKFDWQPETQNDKRRIAVKVIGRYSKLSATMGAATALPSVIPGSGRRSLFCAAGSLIAPCHSRIRSTCACAWSRFIRPS
jgi:hypothetical protein